MRVHVLRKDRNAKVDKATAVFTGKPLSRQYSGFYLL